MIRMTNTLLAALTVLAATAGNSFAGDLAQGKAKAEGQCAACHAKEANWNSPIDPSYPKLAGQYKDYIVQALTQYKNGSRKNGIMAGQAAALTGKEIDDLATFFASLDGQLYLKK